MDNLFPSLLRTQLQLHYEACVICLHETFHFSDVLQNWNRDC